MDEEDLRPLRAKAPQKDLDEMSIEALQGYIAELEREIARAAKAIDAKTLARAGADTFFKT